ncbi:MAG: hypothetical protein MUP82_01705, partial [Candidatus Marinimicrobia bacterium]|nr:hypothetical protein [Candidatus Neomarinimicrobiota bacterium]
TEVIIEEILLREENVTRDRAGMSLLLDYIIPYGKIVANSFYNNLSWDALYRINRMNLTENRHYYDLEDRGGKTSIFTGSIGIKQDFKKIGYDLGYARTSTNTKAPNEKTWTFIQESNAFNSTPTASTQSTEIPTFATNDSFKTGLKEVYVWDIKREEYQSTIQSNLSIPVRFSRKINGLIKMGVKFRWLDRLNDEDQIGRDSFQYGNSNGPNEILQLLHEELPEWDVESLVDQYGLLPIGSFLSDYTREDFLNGEYPLGFVVDQDKMVQLTEAVINSGQFRKMAIGSLERDYDGIERYQAAYLMGEFNIGKHVSILPGIRWEGDYSKYNGHRFREVTRNNIQEEPEDHDSLTITREHDYWLPAIHVQLKPTEWLKVRLARTETLTRPDYIQYAPITTINSYNNYVRAANSTLKPAHSTNYDASISIYQKHVGLFTLSHFRKNIEDMIFQTNYWLRSGLPIVDGLNIPDNWITYNPNADLYINNPYKAYYNGFEIDWQTNFWYLPKVLKGLVLNVNYTNISSEMKKQQYYLGKGGLIIQFPPIYETIVIDSSRTTRLPDQPSHIANVTLGYDFKRFSVRLSYLYQTDRVTFIDRKPELDNFSGPFERWDLALSQKIGNKIQFYANLNNLKNKPDENFRGESLTSPTYIEYYGFTMDIGFRYNL